MKMSVIENVHCSHLECANVICDKNLKILAPVAIGDEIIISGEKKCLDKSKMIPLSEIKKDIETLEEIRKKYGHHLMENIADIEIKED